MISIYVNSSNYLPEPSITHLPLQRTVKISIEGSWTLSSVDNSWTAEGGDTRSRKRHEKDADPRSNTTEGLSPAHGTTHSSVRVTRVTPCVLRLKLIDKVNMRIIQS